MDVEQTHRPAEPHSRLPFLIYFMDKYTRCTMSKAGKSVCFTYGCDRVVGSGLEPWSFTVNMGVFDNSFLLVFLLKSTVFFLNVVEVLKTCISYKYVNY